MPEKTNAVQSPPSGVGVSFTRTIGLTTTISIVVGGIIGSGIFMKPALMVSQLGSPLVLLSVWVVAGFITLAGALSNAEVAAMFPETGGQYVFFKKMYGDGFAFLYGWAAFAVFNTGGVASLAYVCAQYSNYFLHLPHLAAQVEQSVYFHIPFIGYIHPLENIGVKSLTVVYVIILTLINYRSVRYGSVLQNVLTVLKGAALLLLISGILFSGKGSASNITTALPGMPHGFAMLAAYIAALGGAFWAYDGWNYITFVAGEIKNPQKNIQRGLLFGVLAVIAIYTLVNVAYVYILPVQTMAASHFVASDAATIAWGVIGGSLIASLIILSTMGAANSTVLTIARVTYAMAGESRFFNRAGKLQPRYQTPGNALWINCSWTIVLIISGSFDILTSMLVFVTWFFYGSSALGVIILRFKMKDAPRPYKVWGYPYITGLFVGFTAFFLAFTLYADISNYIQGKTTLINSVLGAVITFVGIPVYYFSRRKK